VFRDQREEHRDDATGVDRRGQSAVAAVLEQQEPAVELAPRNIEQMHGVVGTIDSRKLSDVQGAELRAGVHTQHLVGHGHPRAEGAAVLLLRMRPQERVVGSAGRRFRQRAEFAGTDQVESIVFRYVSRLFYITYVSAVRFTWRFLRLDVYPFSRFVYFDN